MEWSVKPTTILSKTSRRAYEAIRPGTTSHTTVTGEYTCCILGKPRIILVTAAGCGTLLDARLQSL